MTIIQAPGLRRASEAYWAGKVNAEHRHSDEYFFNLYAGELLALLPRGGTLVDVGCGSCQVTSHLAGAYDRVVAVDFSRSMLTAARQRLSERQISNVTLVEGDASRIPMNSGTADVILAYGVIQYLDGGALKEHLEECARILAPAGVVCWGLVPNARLRWLWYSGALSNPRPTTLRQLHRTMRMVVRQTRARWKGDLLWDGIGHWFTQEALQLGAQALGFSIEFRHSWFYEYRFHSLLRQMRSSQS
jgi:ubiquinone/menaquinone biosynthesis C-methylase UbiE